MSLRSSSSGDTVRTGPAWLNIGIAIAMVATMFTALLGSASAQASESVAYVWANDPLAESYTPNEMYQYNSTGATNTITRTDVGTYTVNLPGMNGGGGNVQVTATGDSSNDAAPGQVCQLAGEAKGSDFFVICYGLGGVPADVGFSLLYTSGNVFLGWNSAYVWANFTFADLPVVNEDYNFNQTGGTNTVERIDTGHYRVTLPGLAAEEGNVQVTMSNTTETLACTPAFWGFDDQGGKYIEVICFNAAGELVDSSFMLLHVAGVSSHSAEGAWGVWARGAYLWVNHAGSPDRYVPGKNFQFNSAGGDAEVQRTERGAYDITIPNIGTFGGNIQLTPLGTEQAGISCAVTWWEITEASALHMTVGCLDANGAPGDTRFMVSYTYPEP